MTDDAAPGQVPGGEEHAPPPQDADEWGDDFDATRARALIAKLRQEAKAASKAMKELEGLRQERTQAEQAKLSEQERLVQRTAQLEADLKAAQRDRAERELDWAIEREAARAGVADPEAARLLLRASQSGLDIADDGTPTNLPQALKALLKARPWLAGQAPGPTMSVGNGATRQPPAGEQTFTRSQLRDRAFYEKHRDQIREAMAKGLILSE